MSEEDISALIAQEGLSDYEQECYDDETVGKNRVGSFGYELRIRKVKSRGRENTMQN